MSFGRSWGGGRTVGMLISLSEKDRDRLGNNDPQVDIRDGDLAIVVAHSGDWFNTYRKLENSGEGWKLGQRFGAYECGTPRPLPSRTFHLLMAGETVPSLAGDS